MFWTCSRDSMSRGFRAWQHKVKEGPVSAIELLAALPFALILIDEHGIIRDTNSETQTVLNLSQNSLLGRNLADVLNLPDSFSHDAKETFVAHDVSFSTRKGKQLRGDIHSLSLPERPSWQLLTISNARDQLMGVGLDRRGAGRTAIAIAATLAHEIKNPLSGIRGAAQLLETSVSEDDSKMTRLIRTEVDRVTALIDRMEGFTDTRGIELSADNIHAIVEHARNVAEKGFGSELEITEHYDPSLPPVLTHRDSLVQVVINLIKNAAETAVPGKCRKVTLTTRYRHGVALSGASGSKKLPLPIELCVIDDGPGAPEELTEQLFDPFISGKRNGQGLGLALADKLIRDMGGLIQYSREGTPPQTVFRLLLQRA